MKTLPIDDHNQGIFSHELGHSFPIFEKRQGRPPPSPPLVMRLWPLSNKKLKGSAHILLGEGSGKNLDMFMLRKREHYHD